MKHKYLSTALIGLVVLSLAATAPAATVTYDANTGSAGAQDGAGAGWNTSNVNFWNGATDVVWPNTTADVAVFGASSGAAGTVTVGTVTGNGITFSAPGSGSYILSGGTITLGGTTPTITTNAAARIDSSLTNTTVATRFVGSAALTLGGTVTATGQDLVLDGVSSATSTLNVVSGASISANNLYLRQQTGVTSFTGNYNQTGGTVTLASNFQLGNSTTGSGGSNISNATVSGGTLNAGVLRMYKWATSNFTVSGAGVMNATTADIGWVDSSPTGSITLGDGATFSGGTSIQDGGTSGVLTISGINYWQNRNYTLNFKGGMLKASGTVSWNNGATTSTGNNPTVWMPAGVFASATVQDAGGIIDNGGFGITIAQVLSHGGVAATDGGLVFKGGSTTTLSASNSFNGNVTVNSGTLKGTATNAFGSASNTRTITVASGATLDFGVVGMYGGHNSTTVPSLVVNGGTVTNSGASNNNPLNNITLNGGTLTSTVDNGATWRAWDINGTITSTGTSTISSTATNPGILLSSSGTNTNVDVQSGTLTISTFVGDGRDAASPFNTHATSLTKIGTGVLTLSGANAYTGGTTISQGSVVAANNSALGTAGTVTINNAGTGANNTSLLIDASAGNVNIGRAISVANQGSGTTTIGSTNFGVSSNQATFSGAITLAKDVTLVGANGGDRTQFTGGIGGTGNVTVTTTGTGRIIFVTGANTYAGTTTITAGSTLQLSDATSTATSFIPDSSNVTVNGTLKLAKGNNSESFGALSGSGTVKGHEAVANIASAIILGNGGGSGTFSGVLSDGGASGATLAVAKSGAGTQTFTGANTYTGATTLTAGTINLGVAEIVGTSGPLGKSAAANPGSIILNGGTLQYSAVNQNDYSGRFSTAASQAYNVDTNGQTVTWATGLTSAGGSLTKVGAGTLTLSGPNTYTGNTTVTGGSLTFSGTSNLGSSTIFVAPPSSGSATLNVVSGANVTAGTLDVFQNNVTGATATYNQTGGTANFSSLFRLGGSSVGGSSSDTNIANITGGTLTTGTLWLYKWATSTLNISGPATVNATTLDLGWVDSSPTGTINLGDGTTFSGGTSINDGGVSGILSVGSFTVRSNKNYTLNFKGGALKASAGGATWLQASQFTTASVQDAGGIVDNGGFGITIAQVLSHGGGAATDGGLVFKGTNTTTLSGANSFNGGATVSQGALTLTNATAAGSGTITLANSGTGASNTTLNFNVGSGTLANPITVPNLGSGTVTISQGNDFSTLGGLITLNRPTTINSASGDRTGVSGKITGNVGTLTFTGGRTTMDQSAANASDFNGNVVVSTGTLQINSIYALPATADVTVNSGAIFRLNPGANSVVAINGLNGTGNINGDTGGGNNLKTLSVGNNNGSGSYGGSISNGGASDTVALIKTGTGTQTLSGSSTYTGGTILRQGTLIVANNNALSTAGTVTINDAGTGANNTTLTVNSGITLARNITVANAGSGTTTLAFGTGATVASYTGSITLNKSVNVVGGVNSGNPDLNKDNQFATGTISGPGGMTIQSGNVTFATGATKTYSGTTRVMSSAGLYIFNSGAGPANSLLQIDTGGIVVLDGVSASFGSLTGGGTLSGSTYWASNGFPSSAANIGNDNASANFSGVIANMNAGGAGTLSLTKSGTGTQTLSGANTYTGATLVSNGTLKLVAGGSVALGAASDITIAGATTPTFAIEGGSASARYLVVGNATPGNFSMTSGSGNFTALYMGGPTGGGPGSAADANYTQSGGTMTISGPVGVSYQGGSSIMSVSGGTLNATGVIYLSGANTGTAQLNIGGTGFVSADKLELGFNGTNGNLGTFNLNSGGTLKVNQIEFQKGTHVLNFNGGTLLAGDSALGAFFASNAGITANVLAAGAIVDDNGKSITISQALVNGGGGGGLTKLGVGTLQLAGANANTYTGLTTIPTGTLELNKTAGVNAIAGDGNTATNDVLVSGGTLRWLADHQLGTNINLTLTSGTLDLNGKTETDIWSFTNSGGTFVTGVGGVLDGDGTTITWSGGSNTINSAGTVMDPHWVISGGTNTVQGDATGTLQVEAGGAGLVFTGTANPTLTVNSGAASGGRILLQNDVFVDSGLTSGTAQILNGGALANPGFVDLGAGTRTFDINNGSATVDMLISARIANGSLTKTGAGQLRLTGDNTYTGATTVNAGTLELAGGALQNGSINVAAGTFRQTGGTNSVTGANGNLTLAAGASYQLQGGTLNFGDYAAGGTAWNPADTSEISLATGSQFSFTGGILEDVSRITMADNSTFTQNGGNFYVGQIGAGPAAETTINGGFSLLAGTMRFDVFGEDLSPEQCCDGVPSQNDLLTVNGNLLLDSTVSLDFINYTPAFGDALTLFCADEITLGDNFGLDGGFYRIIPDGQGGFALQAIVPEPASVAVWTIIGLAGAAGAWRIRRRKSEMKKKTI